ncbi:unnamed protein product [Soboliphyme baturini]|uniref:Uncharacterized protein n=1 Tax=Soboliphyme baturini TaxID=241478 RepID=A0A183IDF7_9BILA|nr:unnamed protein product [Soboliphyme baturini]
MYDVGNSNPLGAEWTEKLGFFDQPFSKLQDEHAASRSRSVNFLNASNAEQFVRSRFPSICSNELGCCKRFKASLRLQPDFEPVFRPKRPVPYAAISTAEADALSCLISTRAEESSDEEAVMATIEAIEAEVQQVLSGMLPECSLSQQTKFANRLRLILFFSESSNRFSRNGLRPLITLVSNNFSTARIRCP